MTLSVDKLFQAVFERQVAIQPRRLAFVSNSQQLTFQELNVRANCLAHQLQSLGIGPGDIVGICIHSSPELAIACIGVLKTGAAFVGIEPNFPASRISGILVDAGCKVLVLGAAGERFEDFGGHKLFVNGELRRTPAETKNPECRSKPGDLFQVIYTSGSTGEPKGVLVTANSFLRKLEWMHERCPIEDGDVLLMYRSIGLAAGTWDCFMGPLAGVPTVIVGRNELSDPARLWKTLCDHHVSHLFASPMLIQALLDPAEHNKSIKPSLKLVTSSGEHLSKKIVKRWMAMFPEVPLLDVYGTSEYPSGMIREASDTLRRGVKEMKWAPTKATVVRILNDDLSETTKGQTGEIYLSGLHLAEGYLNAPDLTAERFIACPSKPEVRMFRTGDLGRPYEDGTFEVLGRNDDIVNIRGFRVGLAEVECALADHDGLRESAVVAFGDPLRLVTFYVPISSTSEGDLRAYLEQRLPQYMMPAHFIKKPRLPRTHAGKLDRNALLDDWQNLNRKSSSNPPATSLEKQVEKIWIEVLQLPDVGVNDEFLKLGGDSIGAMRILSRINGTFGLSLGFRDLLDSPTIKDQAKLLEARLSK
ncbi:MAG: non-ribosomal peptide synthetase [Verrucomicrobia bacterium]|nr:non-ribosomal peptide synthetase [Verrucomicrobiota bacterium]